MQLRAERIPAKSALEIYHFGPPLSEGPLPAFFYFALSGQDSIELAPYNQPVEFLNGSPIRVFSFTIPGHGPELKNNEALTHWAASFAKGEDPIKDFIEASLENIEFLMPYIDASKMAAGGLSRGAFIATHLAAKEERISYLLGFAPLTRLDLVNEFQGLQVSQKNLEHLIPNLLRKQIRFYIGNLDSRVHTEECFSFIHRLAIASNEQRVRNLNFELNIVPSIGYQGHGTSPETFLNGILWMKEKLGIL